MRAALSRRPAKLALAAAALIILAVAGCGGSEPSEPTPARPGRMTFVAAGAGAAGTGTRQHPFPTIQQALDTARAGDTIEVASGTYPEALTVSRGGRPGSRLRLVAAAGARPVITGRLKIVGDYVVVSGFRFRGQTAANPDDVLVYVSGAMSVRIEGNEIERAGQSGVFVGEGAVDVQILANWIHDNGRDHFLDHGIYYAVGQRGVIANNVIEANVGYGIQLYPNADLVQVIDNTIVGNGRAGIIVGGEEATADDNTMANNIVARNAAQGIRTYWGGPVGTGNVAVNNLVFANAQEDEPEIEALTVRDVLVGDPRFVDVDADDYRLGPGSAAIDRALPEYSTAADFRGVSRPQGEGPDLGAYERSADDP